MKRLTDARMARLLGWTCGPRKERPYDGSLAREVWTDPQTGGFCFIPPAYTRDLGTIVSELDERGLSYGFAQISGLRARAWVDREYAEALTPALALCWALLAHLKGKANAEPLRANQ